MKRLLLLLLCALLLSGCYAHDTIVHLNDDGSGTMEIHVGVNKAYQQQQESLGQVPIDPQTIYEIFSSEVTSFPASWKPSLEYWSDSLYSGARLTVQFTDTAMLQDELNTMREQAGNYNSMITNLTASRQNDHAIVSALLTGRPFDANGDALPQGFSGRFHWEVQAASVTQCTPSRFSGCSSTSALWEFALDALGNGETMTLLSDAQLGTTPTPTTGTATPTLAANATAGAATATSTPTPQGGVVVVATNTPTLTPSLTPLITATAALDAAPTSIGTLPGPDAIRATEEPTEVLILPRGTPIPPVATPASQPPTPGGPSLPTFGASAPTVVAQLPNAPAGGGAAGPAVRYLPLVARDAAFESAGETPPQGSSVMHELRIKRPTLPYRNTLIGLFLLASFLCFGFVLLRRMRQLRQARAAAASPSPAQEGNPEHIEDLAPPARDDEPPALPDEERRL